MSGSGIPAVPHDLPEVPLSSTDTRANRTGSWRHVRPVIAEKAAPCHKACLLHAPIPQVMTALARGDIPAAGASLLNHNPFPAITARVCPHPCQVGCNRGRYDEPINIRAVERFLGDALLHRKGAPPDVSTGRRVAVVGSGPAGLAAAFYLRARGHDVTIYEREAEPGGMLRDAIPAYRLPAEILDAEIEGLRRMGVVFRCGVEIGSDMPLADLLAAHDVVFAATGAHGERGLGAPGEEHLTRGLEFLRGVRRGEITSASGTVAVVGGGNVAIDVARTLVRLGARAVVLYRRTRKEMPAIEEEVEHAIADGVTFEFLTLPVVAERVDGHLRLTLVTMQLGEPDRSGRRRPVPVPGSEHSFECDGAIAAIGEVAETKFLPKEVLDEQGWARADKATGATAEGWLYLGGDLITGPATVSEAIAWGRRAALAIDRRLRGEPPAAPERLLPTVSIKGINLDYFRRAPRTVQPALPVETRRLTFEEEIGGIDLVQAMEEAARCFVCGTCTVCANCWAFCPDAAIELGAEDAIPRVTLDYCKGCGICVVECPRGIIALVDEAKVEVRA
ncbi:MAG: FAD-dependent oxidoreductase [Armatimonadetes bacterium]|nr:FAD-dependent oxidoreductase [Armatimonadota bacterium]